MQDASFIHRGSGRASVMVRLCFILALTGVPLSASAAYRCTQTDGKITYQDIPCPVQGEESPPAAPPAAPAAAAPAPQAPAPQPVAAVPVPQAPAVPDRATQAPAAQPGRVPDTRPEPYLGGDGSEDGQYDNADGNAPDDEYDTADTASDPSDTADDNAMPDQSASAAVVISPFRIMLWLGLAGLVGYRATQRNRGFFKWSFMALVFSPAIIYLILRLMGTAEESA